MKVVRVVKVWMGPNEALDILWQTWALRCFSVALLALPFWGAYLFYNYKLGLVDAELEKESIKADVEKAKHSRPEIPINTYKDRSPESEPGPAKWVSPPPPMTAPPVSHMNDEKYDQGGLLAPFDNEPPEYDEIRVSDSKVLLKDDVIEFVEKSLEEDGPGLAIGQWKKEGWNQEDVEALLDYLASIGLVTERRVGVACKWTKDLSSNQVLKIMSENKL